MINQLPILNASLIKVVGVFNYTKKQKADFIAKGYKPLPICLGHEGDLNLVCKDLEYIHDNYYAEFSDLFFNSELPHALPLYLDEIFEVKFLLNDNTQIDCKISYPELYFFSNDGTGIFSLTIEIFENSLEKVSNITYCASSFDGKIKYKNEVYKFHEWISKYILAETPLRGKQVQSDKFSGSKFKIYTVIDLIKPHETEIYNLDNLLFEIGTRSKLLTMQENGYNAPSQNYFEEIMKSKLSVFNNYHGLALLDSFTIIGTNLYPASSDNDLDLIKRNLFKRIYFSMYVFNLYVKYSIFRFNATFKEDEVKKRDEFEDFINHFNFKHVSFNFLPNIFFNKMRNSLNIDEEINHFEKRLQKLADSIKEEQEKRQGILLGIISALSSITALEPILDYLNQFSIWLGITGWPFYLLSFFTLMLLIIPVLYYLYPSLFTKLKKKFL